MVATGKGVRGTVEGRTVALGNRTLMDDQHSPEPVLRVRLQLGRGADRRRRSLPGLRPAPVAGRDKLERGNRTTCRLIAALHQRNRSNRVAGSTGTDHEGR